MTGVGHDTEVRYVLAQGLCRRVGEWALGLFRQRETLAIESKGLQDMVSRADREVEEMVRAEVAARFPDDGFVGEEGGVDKAGARYVWVIDPIDGTACFVNGMHAWCISVAVMHRGEPVIGVVIDPNSGEIFHAMKGGGAYVGLKPVHVHPAATVRDGVLGVGFSHRVPPSAFVPFLERLLHDGGMFIRNGSGALMLAYVAAGRLIGYYEPHINAWDCLAGIVLVLEAGGAVNDFLSNDGLLKGNPILASGPALFSRLAAMAGEAVTRMPAEAQAPRR
jgi:myo-inositol-1(or 4)-monophosphatase